MFAADSQEPDGEKSETLPQTGGERARQTGGTEVSTSISRDRQTDTDRVTQGYRETETDRETQTGRQTDRCRESMANRRHRSIHEY